MGRDVLVRRAALTEPSVADLVTDHAHRSEGVGRLLLERCEQIAVTLGCVEIVLDSGVQRTEAHRFYFRERFGIHAFNFSKRLIR